MTEHLSTLNHLKIYNLIRYFGVQFQTLTYASQNDCLLFYTEPNRLKKNFKTLLNVTFRQIKSSSLCSNSRNISTLTLYAKSFASHTRLRIPNKKPSSIIL